MKNTNVKTKKDMWFKGPVLIDLFIYKRKSYKRQFCHQLPWGQQTCFKCWEKFPFLGGSHKLWTQVDLHFLTHSLDVELIWLFVFEI